MIETAPFPDGQAGGAGHSAMVDVNATRTVEPFDLLPRRLFLDSSTLQTLLRYGEFIWENIEPAPGDRAHRIPGFTDDLRALRLIFQVNQRAAFDIALSRNSLAEVNEKGDPAYTAWGLAVIAHWYARIARYGGSAFTGTGASLASRLDAHEFGYLSTKDKHLLQDALALKSDAFLTMDQKLTRNADHLQAMVGLMVLRPPTYWALLRPWAGLYL